MYSYEWDPESGGLLLKYSEEKFSKEPRPVYYKELDLLGFDKYWNYEKDDSKPYMWAEMNSYIYKGRLVAKTKGGSLYTKPEIILVEEPEPDGTPLSFVDIDLMCEKNRETMDKISNSARQDIFNTYNEHRDKVDVFYVAFSGGKDSVVTLDLVQNALPHNSFKVIFGDTGMEFPDTYKAVEIIEKYCRDLNIEFLRSKAEFDPEYSWRKFGPPTQNMRWCCSVHKTAPQINFLRAYTKDPHFIGMAFTGIRASESATRASYEQLSFSKKIKGQYSFHPILHWTSAELFIYIFMRKLQINEAYKKGNSRAGCLVCPLESSKNTYFKAQCYSFNNEGYPTTTIFHNLIKETTNRDISSKDKEFEFMDKAVWKANKSGKELNFAKDLLEYELKNHVFTVTMFHMSTDWKEWIKTLGEIVAISLDSIKIKFNNKVFLINFETIDERIVFSVIVDEHSKTDILFMSSLRTVFRKSAYCIHCRVCEANCPNGYISMKDGLFSIDDKCVKCRKCHEVAHGCLVANSMRLPKKGDNMGGINRYTNLGVEFKWVKEYFKSDMKDDFEKSPHSLGPKMLVNLKKFLNDSGITVKNKFSDFGRLIEDIGIDNSLSWALMLCNLVYTAEFNWWIKYIEVGEEYTKDKIQNCIQKSMDEKNEKVTLNTKEHVVSAFKNIFISTPLLGNEIGIGVCDYELKGNLRILKSIIRHPWSDPDPRVILYSLYKYAERNGVNQFSFSSLYEEIDEENEGISPYEIFKIGRDSMEKILNSLSVNYPEFINASFTLDLDVINLRDDKTSADVLTLFKERN